MIAGLPLESWLLIVPALGLGLAVELAFYLRQSRRRFWKRTTRAGAVAGMIGGFATAVVWVVVFKARVFDLYEMIPGFLVGVAVTVGVSLFTDPPEDAAAELESVRRGHGVIRQRARR